MHRPRSVHERPRFRKRFDLSQPSPNATTFKPPESEEVEVEVLGMPSGMRRIDRVAVSKAPEPTPEPPQPPAEEPEAQPEEAPTASPKASPEPLFGAHLGRHQ